MSQENVEIVRAIYSAFVRGDNEAIFEHVNEDVEWYEPPDVSGGAPAGANAKSISTYMGHSSIEVTFDKYGHLMPGNEDETAALLDSYLEGRTRFSHTVSHSDI